MNCTEMARFRLSTPILLLMSPLRQRLRIAKGEAIAKARAVPPAGFANATANSASLPSPISHLISKTFTKFASESGIPAAIMDGCSL
jgi:hypothetical protein